MNLIVAGLSMVITLQPVPDPPRPPAGGSHPRDHDVLVHRVTPEGEVEHVTTFEGAGVPTIVSLGGDRLLAAHQWFPDDIPEEDEYFQVGFVEKYQFSTICNIGC